MAVLEVYDVECKDGATPITGTCWASDMFACPDLIIAVVPAANEIAVFRNGSAEHIPEFIKDP